MSQSLDLQIGNQMSGQAGLRKEEVKCLCMSRLSALSTHHYQFSAGTRVHLICKDLHISCACLTLDLKSQKQRQDIGKRAKSVYLGSPCHLKEGRKCKKQMQHVLFIHHPTELKAFSRRFTIIIL